MEFVMLQNAEEFEEYKDSQDVSGKYKHFGAPTHYPCKVYSEFYEDPILNTITMTHKFLYQQEILCPCCYTAFKTWTHTPKNLTATQHSTMSRAAVKADESADIIMRSILSNTWRWPQVRPDDLYDAIIHHQEWWTYRSWIDLLSYKCRGKSKSEIFDELSTVHLVWTEYDDPLTSSSGTMEKEKYPLFRIVNNLMLARYATKTIWYNRASKECPNLEVKDVQEARRLLLFKKEDLTWSEAETLLALIDFLSCRGLC